MQDKLLRSMRLATVAVWAAHAWGAPQSDVPHPAPPFELPRIAAQGYIRSENLFPAQEFTFLVFWNSECPRCVESLLQCEDFYETQSPETVSVVGIHTGEGDPFMVERMLVANGIRFPQLWDFGGEIARSYGILPTTFTLVLVDGDKIIRGHRSDPKGNMGTHLGEMLSSAKAPLTQVGQTTSVPMTGEESLPEQSLAGFVFHGDERIRFLSIDSRGEFAVGPFGEAIEPGNTFLYRFDLEVTRRITRHLRVGGLLRISNEDEDVLEAGPEYFGSRWGSAFAEFTAGGLLLSIGYYEITSTPLTLMRWDWNDNPRIGGNAGCGCGAAAGVLLVNSLEELAPELVFEGAVATWRRAGVETRAFYAIPRRADETSYREASATGADRASYSLELGGLETTWQRFDPRTGSAWRLGTRVAATWEDDRSVDFVELGYRWPDPSFSSAILTADAGVPLWRFIDFEGEWVLWNKAEENAEACCDTTYKSEGKGGIAGLVFKRPPGWRFRADYMYLGRGFYSPFAALSYEPNREGARFSAEVPLFRDRVLATVFYKRLRETETPTSGAEEEQESLTGTSLDVDLPSGFGGSLGWLDNGIWRNGTIDPVDDVRKALVVLVRYRFQKWTSLEIQYERVERTTSVGGRENESISNLYSAYLTARF